MPKLAMIKPSEIKIDRPIYKPLLDALKGGVKPDDRVVEARELRISPKFRVREEDVAMMVRNLESALRVGQEFMDRVLVMERSDGSLWVYDHCGLVEAVLRVEPGRLLPCAVFRDPTR